MYFNGVVVSASSIRSQQERWKDDRENMICGRGETGKESEEGKEEEKEKGGRGERGEGR